MIDKGFDVVLTVAVDENRVSSVSTTIRASPAGIRDPNLALAAV